MSLGSRRVLFRSTDSLGDLFHGPDSAHLADVKLICDGGQCVFWAHRPVLASVSTLLKHLFLEAGPEASSVVTVHLPDVAARPLKAVLDYVYTGAMYLCAAEWEAVLRVIEVLRIHCGVSVSKMVPVSGGRGRSGSKRIKRESQWVEAEAQFMGLAHMAGLKREEEGLWEAKPDLPTWPPSGVQPVPVAELESPRRWVSEPPLVVHPEVTAKARLHRGLSSVEVLDDEDDEEDEDGLEDHLKDDAHRPSSHPINESSAIKPECPSDSICVMCGKNFKHEDNLRVHLRSHLGLKAVLPNCQICTRNFRSQLEHNLHKESHRYARFMKRAQLTSYPTLASNAKSNRPQNLWQASKCVRRALKVLRQKLPTLQEQSHIGTKHLAVTTESRKSSRRQMPSRKKLEQNQGKKSNQVIGKLCESNLISRPKQARVILKPIKFRGTSEFLQTPIASKVSTPNRRKRTGSQSTVKISKSPAETLSPTTLTSSKSRSRKSSTASLSSLSADARSSKASRKSSESNLTCPTCDKTFIARSIFDRHVRTYKHGIFAQLDSPQPTPLYIPHSSAPPLPHFNTVVQPTIEVQGRQMNKYECHLCQKVFLRVKDLVKHRERMCSAWNQVGSPARVVQDASQGAPP
ncbi:hypothetical protein TCAL_02111 [Tigriopus californicus]|uniref:BTB domain-containing protein n=1 Tax=Tigriopus californicus TaxID=6832 RepID=A0A553N9X4_TIGCA|nr:uncharacterized protein LOC131884826 [Tigriopus californicus]TRY62195.1 hypothetical protein TCAL_02111 [Tigriopus californicus]|eukprot:TCALIF_02111-PA protein Name:"Similar to ken1 Transcription factor Ken 1 (Culex quinquefasciatus)" AED:0.00 eAED:0.00 QI:13/1/1/1/1/1/3/134/630